ILREPVAAARDRYPLKVRRLVGFAEPLAEPFLALDVAKGKPHAHRARIEVGRRGVGHGVTSPLLKSGASSLMRPRAVSAYSGFSSTPTNERPRRSATRPVVPLPANGSRTTHGRVSSIPQAQVARKPRVETCFSLRSANPAVCSRFPIERGPLVVRLPGLT